MKQHIHEFNYKKHIKKYSTYRSLKDKLGKHFFFQQSRATTNHIPSKNLEDKIWKIKILGLLGRVQIFLSSMYITVEKQSYAWVKQKK